MYFIFTVFEAGRPNSDKQINQKNVWTRFSSNPSLQILKLSLNSVYEQKIKTSK